MAHIARLTPPRDGISEYLNVDAKVGSDANCPNRRDDVEAVQRFLSIVLTGRQDLRFAPPVPTGAFDVNTAYYIYHLQHRVAVRDRGTIVDGCISPARGLSYGGGVYSILHLNAMAQEANRAAWAAVLDRYRASGAGTPT